LFQSKETLNFSDALPFIKDADLVVIDGYLFDDDYLKSVAEACRKSLMIDDFNNRNLSHFDGVLNFTISAFEKGYSNRIQLLGLEYFIHNAGLSPIREVNIKREAEFYKSVLIALGGTMNDEKFELGLLEAVDQALMNESIYLLSNHVDKYKYESVNGNQIQLKKPYSKFYELLSEVGVVISGGGLLKYESAYCAIPNGTISLNQGQQKETDEFKTNGLTYDIGNYYEMNLSEIKSNLNVFLSDKQAQKNIWNSSKVKFSSESQQKLLASINALLDE
jgi:spore coat polysaccharide biosynthesis predicted glycosyltransferase SpsG